MVDRMYAGKRFKNSQMVVYLVPGLTSSMVYALARRMSDVCFANPPPDFLKGPGFRKVFAQVDQPPWKTERNKLLRVGEAALKACGLDPDRIWLEHDGGEIWICKPHRFIIGVINTRAACTEWQASKVLDLGIPMVALVKAVEDQAVF